MGIGRAFDGRGPTVPSGASFLRCYDRLRICWAFAGSRAARRRGRTPLNRKRQPPEVSIVRSSAAEYLTFVAATGSQQQAVEMRYEDENIWLSQKMMATLSEPRAPAEAQRAEREKAQAERARKAKAQADAARQRHLTELARDVEGGWSKREKLVEASDYEVAVKLAIDLRDLASREATAPAFARRFEALRKCQLRRRGFFDRWKRANENDSRDW